MECELYQWEILNHFTLLLPRQHKTIVHNNITMSSDEQCKCESRTSCTFNAKLLNFAAFSKFYETTQRLILTSHNTATIPTNNFIHSLSFWADIVNVFGLRVTMHMLIVNHSVSFHFH